MTPGPSQTARRKPPIEGEIVTFAVGREPGGWFISAPQRIGPFPSRGAVVEAAEILASWVRDDGEKAVVIYASPSFQGG